MPRATAYLVKSIRPSSATSRKSPANADFSLQSLGIEALFSKKRLKKCGMVLTLVTRSVASRPSWVILGFSVATATVSFSSSQAGTHYTPLKDSTPMSTDDSNKPREISTGLSGDELDQVRELLFGGTIREIERQREALQKDVNAGFAEADQMTNRRLDDVMRRLDSIQQELARDRDLNKQQFATESQNFDKTLVKLASEQSSALAQESARIDAKINAEAKRLDEALEKESKRIDEAMDALHRQLETERLQHLEALRKSVSAERSRLAAGIRQFAEGIHKEKSGD